MLQHVSLNQIWLGLLVLRVSGVGIMIANEDNQSSSHSAASRQPAPYHSKTSKRQT